MPRTPEGERWSAASLALPAALLAVAVVGLVLLNPDGSIVDCERDGHFQRAGQLACGVVAPNAPYGPLLPWLVTPLIPLLGTPYLAGRAASFLALLGAALLSWRASRELGASRGLAALVALAVGCNGPMLSYGTMACSDLPATALFLWAGWLSLRSVERDAGWRTPALAGLALAAACLVRVQYYLAVPVLGVTALALSQRRGRLALALGLGFAVPVSVAFARGWSLYGSPVESLEQHLGLAAYSRNLLRAGDILERSAGGGAPDVVGLGARLRWAVTLMLRVTGGLPLLALSATLWLSLRRRRWRRLLVPLLPALALVAGLAWSHPPPDWGARRFYLFLVPLGALATLLPGELLLHRWLAGRRSRTTAALLVVAAVAAHGLWELRSFRPGVLPGGGGSAAAYERGVVMQARELGRDLPVCAPVATNFHPAATAFRNAWFLGDVTLEERRWAEALPRREGEPCWMLWVPPDAGSSPELLMVEGAAGGVPRLGETP